jgi:hypothetical protein
LFGQCVRYSYSSDSALDIAIARTVSYGFFLLLLNIYFFNLLQLNLW